MVLGPLLAHFAVVPPLAGFAMFALGGIVAAIVGLVSLVQLVRGYGLTAGGALGLIAAVAFVFLATSQGRGHPRINDFTTDPADPPAFRGERSTRTLGATWPTRRTGLPSSASAAPTCIRRC